MDDDGSFRTLRLLTILFSFVPSNRGGIPSFARAGTLGLPRFRLRRPGVPDLRKIFRITLRVSFAGAIVWAITYELRTSALQSRVLSYYAQRMSFTVERGPSASIVFPAAGRWRYVVTGVGPGEWSFAPVRVSR